MSGCFICEKHARGDDVPGGVIYEDDLVYAGHILPPDLDSVYLGYLIVETKRHVARLGDLTDDEAAAVGRLVNRVGAALRDSEDAEHVYVFVLGDEVPHFHVHVVPRYPGTPREFYGKNITAWDAAPRGGVAEIAAVAERLRMVLEEPMHG